MLGTHAAHHRRHRRAEEEYLGRLLAEPIFAAYCCSEPDAGSDVAGMKTRYQKVGDDYVLTGQKRWITNGGVASFYTVFAREEGTPATRASPASSSTATAPGVSVGKKENKMGQRCSNTTDVIFEEVKVGKAALVGAEGEGFKVAMRTFDRTRPWIAAGAAGHHPARARRIAQVRARAQDLRRADRPAPGGPVHARRDGDRLRGDAPALPQGGLAGSTRGQPDSIVSSYAKAYGADAAMRVATDAVQIFGGYGYTKEYPVEKLMRDAKLLQIYEGTSQIQRMVIARNVLGG